MASVWVARLQGKHGFEKLVAIKMILPKYAQDARFERMFLDEAGIASRIEHANVAQILDLGEVHDILYLAMEWVDGDALSKLLRAVQKKGKSLPPGIALRILADTCGGLHAAHELHDKDGQPLGVVHRDVSPQNILVSMSGVAKLIDFGIAKARDRVTEETSGGTMKGKIHYMAPEQALGRPVDRRADIWAVGAILYYLFTGKPPYDADNQLATLHLLGSGKPPPSLPLTVHPAIRAIVDKALTHDPDKRYQTAAEMQMALEGAMSDARFVTTTTHVATFVREYMAERARRRKEAIDVALSAAAERARVSPVLERAGLASSSGVADRSGGVPALTLPTNPSAPGGPASSSQPRDVAAMGALPLALSETSSATLGSAALASPLPSLFPPPPRHRTWLGVLVAGVLLLAVGAGLAFTGVLAAKPPPTAAPPPPASDTVPSASAPPIAATEALPPASAAPSASASASATAPPVVSVKTTPHWQAPHAPASAASSSHHHRVDDGF